MLVKTLHEFTKRAKAGKLRQGTGKELAGEENAESPFEMGILNGYSLDDICHFYASRRGAFMKHIQGKKGYCGFETGYGEFKMDIRSGV